MRLHATSRSSDATPSIALGHRHDVRAQRKDGTEFLAQIGVGQWLTPSGPMVVACVVDSSSLRRAERTSHANELAAVEAADVSQAIIAEAAVGTFIYDAESGDCVSANAAASTIIGLPVDVLQAQNFRQLKS